MCIGGAGVVQWWEHLPSTNVWGSIPAWCYYVEPNEFVVGSCLASRVFLQVLQFFFFFFEGKQGWHSGESTRLPPMWPRFDFWTRRSYVGRVCCWFSSLLWGFISKFSSFPPSSKTNTPNSNSISYMYTL